MKEFLAKNAWYVGAGLWVVVAIMEIFKNGTSSASVYIVLAFASLCIGIYSKRKQ